MRQCHPSNACTGANKKVLRITGEQPVEDIIVKAKARQYTSIHLIGEEPFLYCRFMDIIEKLSDYKTCVTTNGCKLDDVDMIRSIAPALSALNLRMGFYSVTGNAEVTGIKLNMAKVRESIIVLNSFGVRTRIEAVLLKGHLDNLADCTTMAHFAASLKAHSIRFCELNDPAKLPDLYVDATEAFPELNGAEPYFGGCNREIKLTDKIACMVKMSCGMINPFRTKPEIAPVLA